MFSLPAIPVQILFPPSDLRNAARFPHPMFGNFTAHQWTCMFSLHLRVHLRQAALLAGNGKEGC